MAIRADEYLVKVGPAISEIQGKKCNKWQFSLWDNGAYDEGDSRDIRFVLVGNSWLFLSKDRSCRFKDSEQKKNIRLERFQKYFLLNFNTTHSCQGKPNGFGDIGIKIKKK